MDVDTQVGRKRFSDAGNEQGDKYNWIKDTGYGDY